MPSTTLTVSLTALSEVEIEAKKVYFAENYCANRIIYQNYACKERRYADFLKKLSRLVTITIWAVCSS